MKNRRKGKPALNERAAYQVKVQGRLDESWSRWFGEMTITRQGGDDDTSITTITGFVADQSSLRGILSRIWDMNLKLISVVPVDDDTGEVQEKNTGKR